MLKGRGRALRSAVCFLAFGLVDLGCQPAPASSVPLRIGFYAPPLGPDPHLYNEYVSFTVSAHVYETLTSLDPFLRVGPALAQSWDSPDEWTWRLHLRRGVRFHDGRPLTAADVAFSLERARSHPSSEYAGYLVTLQRVRVLDEATLELVTHRPNSMLLNKLAFIFIVPQGAPERIDQPLGTGPYRAHYQPDGSVRLTAFDGYWGPPPAEREALLTFFESRIGPARSLLAGEVDVVVDPAPEEVQRLRAAPGIHITTLRSPSVDILYMRLDAPPFSDVRVRQAIHLALDRPALVQTLLSGLGQASAQPVSRGTFGFDPDAKPPSRDLAAARRLLAQAGYPGGFDVALELRDDLRADSIAAQLADAGLRVTLKPARADALLKRLASGEARFAYLTLLCDSGDASDTFESALHSRARGFGASNYAGYGNRALDELIETSAGTRQLGERRRLLQQCTRLAMKDLPMIPLFERDWSFAFREDVRWETRADGRLLASDLHRATGGS